MGNKQTTMENEKLIERKTKEAMTLNEFINDLYRYKFVAKNTLLKLQVIQRSQSEIFLI